MNCHEERDQKHDFQRTTNTLGLEKLHRCWRTPGMWLSHPWNEEGHVQPQWVHHGYINDLWPGFLKDGKWWEMAPKRPYQPQICNKRRNMAKPKAAASRSASVTSVEHKVRRSHADHAVLIKSPKPKINVKYMKWIEMKPFNLTDSKISKISLFRLVFRIGLVRRTRLTSSASKSKSALPCDTYL